MPACSRRHRAGEPALARHLPQRGSLRRTPRCPKSADPKAPPRWKTVDESGTLRLARPPDALHGAGHRRPRSTTRASGPRSSTTRSRCAVDGRDGAIDGTLYWVGPADTSKRRSSSPAALIVLGGGAAGADRPRRRRGRGDEATSGAAQGSLVVPVRLSGSRSPSPRSLRRCCSRRAPPRAHARSRGPRPPRGATVEAASRARSSSASASRSRATSARCASTTPRAGGSTRAKPSTPAARARSSASTCKPDLRRRQLHRHLPRRLRRRPHRLRRLRLLDRQGRAGAGGDRRRTGRRTRAAAPRPRSAFGIARGVQYAALALGARRARLPAARLAAGSAPLGGGGRGAGSGRARAFERRLRAVLLLPPRPGALSAAAGDRLRGAPRRPGSRPARRSTRRSCARSSAPGSAPSGGSPPSPGSLFGARRWCRRCGERRRWRCSALLSPRSPSSPWSRRCRATRARSRRSRCSSRPTSSTSSRWRSGSAAWRRCSSSCPPRPASWSRRPQPPARGGAGALLADGAALRRRRSCSPASVQAYAYVRDLDNLLDTAYGRAVLIKFAPARRPADPARRLQPLPLGAAPGADRGRAGRRPAGPGCCCAGRCAARWRCSSSSSASPPRWPATRRRPRSRPGRSRQSSAGPAGWRSTVDPARVGANQIHLYLFDARSGAQFAGVKELEVTATLPEQVDRAAAARTAAARPRPLHGPGAALGAAGSGRLDWSPFASPPSTSTRGDVEVPVG